MMKRFPSFSIRTHCLDEGNVSRWLKRGGKITTFISEMINSSKRVSNADNQICKVLFVFLRICFEEMCTVLHAGYQKPSCSDEATNGLMARLGFLLTGQARGFNNDSRDLQVGGVRADIMNAVRR